MTIDAKTVAELAAKQIEALYDADVCSPAQNYCRNKLRMEAAADLIAKQEAQLVASAYEMNKLHDRIAELERLMKRAYDEGILNGAGSFSRNEDNTPWKRSRTYATLQGEQQ